MEHIVTTLPSARRPDCPFDPPQELVEARAHDPISPYTFPGGKPGWLVTGYDLVRSALADPRLSSRRELMGHPSIDITGMEIPPAPPGEFLLMDEPRHGRYRKPLAGKFTVRRMRLLTERVEQITADHLDAMAKAGPPADLVNAFAEPIPAVVICELLGMPYQDRGSFQEHIKAFLSGEASDEDQLAAYTATQHYLAELVAAKRANPTDDVLSELTDSDLTDEELRGISLILLAAGLDTTANMLAPGTFALLRNPAQLAALRADPTLVDRAVEELLRYLSVAKTFMRTALEDVELGGRTIEAGSTVILSYNTANRDPERIADPTCSTSGGRTAVTWPSASTSAWVSSSPATRCGSRSPHSRRGRAAPGDRGRLRGEEPPGHLGHVTGSSAPRSPCGSPPAGCRGDAAPALP